MAKKYTTSLGEQKIFQSSTFVQHEEVKKNIIILPELQALIPPLGDEERNQLKVNILKDGCREALLIWPTVESTVLAGSDSLKPVYILVDGHNRYGICRENNLDFPIHFVSYETLTEVKDFMIDNQLGRRNLSMEQASYLRGMKYLNLRQNRGKYERSDHKDQNGPYDTSLQKKTTAQQLAEEFSVGQTTIKRDAEFAQGLEMLTPELKLEVLAGRLNISKSTIQQLAKGAAPEAPIGSVKDIEVYLTPPKKPNTADTSDLVMENQLIDELTALIYKLRNPKKRKETCEKVISLTARLKEIS